MNTLLVIYFSKILQVLILYMFYVACLFVWYMQKLHCLMVIYICFIHVLLLLCPWWWPRKGRNIGDYIGNCNCNLFTFHKSGLGYLHTYIRIYLLPYIHLQEIHPRYVETVTINTDTECLLNYICHNNTNVTKFT